MITKNLFHKSTLLAICLALLTNTIALAASGDLDTTFSGDGKIIQSFAGDAHIGRDVAVQSDGKVVVVGERDFLDGAGDVTSSDFVIARYNTDGSLDSTFDGDGRRLVNFGTFDMAYSVAIQTDGKIVVSGDTCVFMTNMICDLAVARLNSNGSLDSSFSGDGRVTTDIGGLDNGGGGIAIMSGKVVVAGYAYNGSNYNGAVYRYTSTGILDTTFSGDGIFPIDFGADDYLNAVAIYSGNIYVTGESSSSASASDFVTARIFSNGTLDTFFGVGGIVTTNLGGYDAANDLAISSGHVIVVGYSDNKVAIVKYTGAGDFDTSFSGDGKIVASLGFASPRLSSVTLQGTKIIVVGSTNSTSSAGTALVARYTAGGALDTTFSGDGILTTNWGAGAEEYYSVVFKNSRIYTVGRSFATVNRFIIGAYKP